ncbi:MAG TPA: VOC family protein [Hyphomicrobiaceae bacterium]|nr:VOC family protein [Hyphomicrobiaceae bacterium]
MIDHVSLSVSDMARSTRFYRAALEPLGYRCLTESSERAAFGKRYPELWLNARPGMRPIEAATGAHICLRARTKSEIEAFHAGALAAGGTCDGPPGMRKALMVDYFAAFVRDPDGNRIEAMTVPAAGA